MAHKNMVKAVLEPLDSVKHFRVETTVFMICQDLNGGLTYLATLLSSLIACRWVGLQTL